MGIDILYFNRYRKSSEVIYNLIDKDINFTREFIDNCHWAKPIFKREKGVLLKSWILDKNYVLNIYFLDIRSCGCNPHDKLQLLKLATENKVNLIFLKEKKTTLDSNREATPFLTNLIEQLSETSSKIDEKYLSNQKRGIVRATKEGLYRGRRNDTKDDIVKFLSKPKNRVALRYISAGSSNLKVIDRVRLSKNTVTKIRKIFNEYREIAMTVLRKK